MDGAVGRTMEVRTSYMQHIYKWSIGLCLLVGIAILISKLPSENIADEGSAAFVPLPSEEMREEYELPIDHRIDAYYHGVAVLTVYPNSAVLTRYGYILDTGKILVEPIFDMANNFSDNYGRVNLNDLWYLVLPNGVVCQDGYDRIDIFSEGLAVVEVGAQYGYIDGSGTLAIETQFDYAYPFSEGLASVRLNQDRGYIDYFGELVINLGEFNGSLGDFTDGLAQITYFDRPGALTHYGFMNQAGEFVIEPIYSQCSEWQEDQTIFMRLADNDLWGVLNSEGEYTIPPIFQDIDYFHDGLAVAKIEGKYGYINTDGQWMIEPQYDGAEAFWNGIAIVYPYYRISPNFVHPITGERILNSNYFVYNYLVIDTEGNILYGSPQILFDTLTFINSDYRGPENLNTAMRSWNTVERLRTEMLYPVLQLENEETYEYQFIEEALSFNWLFEIDPGEPVWVVPWSEDIPMELVPIP